MLYAANHRLVEIPASNLKKNITKILFEKGYILNYKFEDDSVLRVQDKDCIEVPSGNQDPCNHQTGKRAFHTRFAQVCQVPINLPRVMNGLGIAIMSTSTRCNYRQRSQESLNVGGEVICYVS